MTTRQLLLQLLMVVWYLTTVVAVGGALYVWAQRNRICRNAFRAGVAEGKALERLKIQAAMSSDTTLDEWIEDVLSSERREDVWEGGSG